MGINILDRLFKSRLIVPDCPIGMRGRPLLTRYFIFRSKWLGIFLHQFHRSDVDDFHDHPWSFITILLSSGYFEHIPAKSWFKGNFDRGHDRFWRQRFSILYRPATFRHFVELPQHYDGSETPVWTMVIRFRRIREWGFIIRGEWIPWRKAEQLQSRSICEDDV